MKYHFIFTASIIEEQTDIPHIKRDLVYAGCIRDTMSKLSHLPITFYVVENNSVRETLLDTLENIHVVYTDSNAETGWNMGKKEFYDIQQVAERFQFADEDIVFKITGRYTIERPSFIERVMDYEEHADVFLKFYSFMDLSTYKKNDCILGLYAVRYNVLKGFTTEGWAIDTCAEIAFATYVRKVVDERRIMEVPFLDMYFRGNPKMHM